VGLRLRTPPEVESFLTIFISLESPLAWSKGRRPSVAVLHSSRITSISQHFGGGLKLKPLMTPASIERTHLAGGGVVLIAADGPGGVDDVNTHVIGIVVGRNE